MFSMVLLPLLVLVLHSNKLTATMRKPLRKYSLNILIYKALSISQQARLLVSR